MKLLRETIRRIIKESLEEEGVLDSMFLSGDWNQIKQAITLAEDMAMPISDLPWEKVPNSLTSPSGWKNMEEEIGLLLAKIVVDEIPHNEIAKIAHRFDYLYQLATKEDQGMRTYRAKRNIGPMALSILINVKNQRKGEQNENDRNNT